jgi:hypothetical protein
VNDPAAAAVSTRSPLGSCAKAEPGRARIPAVVKAAAARTTVISVAPLIVARINVERNLFN